MRELAPLALARPMETAAAYQEAQQRRKRAALLTGIVATLILGLLYAAANGNIAVPLAPVLLLALVIVVWRSPGALLPITVSCACLFELQPYGFADSITDRVPLFWDVNTIFQTYAHVNFHGLPISLYEMILMLACVAGGVKAIFDKKVGMKGGALLAPMGAYLLCVMAGVLHGLATGGQFNIALFEIRAQVYVFLAYLIALNCGQDAQDAARGALWSTIICVGIKGALLTFRYLITLGGHTTAEQGVGSHEESFFFDLFALLYVTLKLGNAEPRMRTVMLCLMPLVLIANLANMRRTATGALALAVPTLLYLSYVAFPQRRRVIAGLTIGVVFGMAAYLPAFWNSDSTLGQPARAVRSHFDPDARDLSSDQYRLQEDANLMATMRTDPAFGFGYGKPIIQLVPMVDLTEIDPLIFYITHDQILWVWMRLGTIGFIVFWIMVAHWLIRTGQLASDRQLTPLARSVGVYTAVVIVSLLMFGLYDMQLSNMRDMLFAGTFLGLTAALLRQRGNERILADLSAAPRIIHGHAVMEPVNVEIARRERFRSSVMANNGASATVVPREWASPRSGAERAGVVAVLPAKAPLPRKIPQGDELEPPN